MNDATHDLINSYLGYGHLLLNHIPIVLLPVILFQLIYFKNTKNENAIRFVLKFLVFAATISIATYLTGENAERMVDGFPGVSEDMISAHESSAQLALVFIVLVMVESLIILILKFNLKTKELILKSIRVTLALGCFALIYVGYTGGRVRHTEVRNLHLFPK